MAYVIRMVGRGTPLGAIDQPNLPGSSQPTVNKGGYIESPGWYPGNEPTVPQQPPQPGGGGGGGGLSPFKKLFTAANYVPLLPSVTPTPSQGTFLPPRVIDVPPAPDGSGSGDDDGETIPHPQLPPADGSVEPQPQVPPPSESPPDGHFPIVPTSTFPTDFATSAARIKLWSQQHKKAIMWGSAVALLALVGSRLLK